jgi:redox-sensitive bicupin YhaK (pirin superfamily)
VHQDVDVWMTLIAPGERRELPLRPGRHGWVHVARGAVSLNGVGLHEGDGAAVSEENSLSFLGDQASEVLVFDLA